MKNRYITSIALYSIACALLLVCYFLFGQSLISAIYHGNAHPMLNRTISNQSYLPLSYYQALALR